MTALRSANWGALGDHGVLVTKMDASGMSAFASSSCNGPGLEISSVISLALTKRP